MQRPTGLHIERGSHGIGFTIFYGEEPVTPAFQDEAAAKYLFAHWEAYIATMKVLPDWRRWPVEGMKDAIAKADAAKRERAEHEAKLAEVHAEHEALLAEIRALAEAKPGDTPEAAALKAGFQKIAERRRRGGEERGRRKAGFADAKWREFADGVTAAAFLAARSKLGQRVNAAAAARDIEVALKLKGVSEPPDLITIERRVRAQLKVLDARAQFLT
jgi:hypothetical protein